MLRPFELERFFAKYEFNVKHVLCVSDCEAMSMEELVKNADEELQEQWRSLRLSYTDAQGLPQLRKEICEAFHPTLNQDQVVVLAPEEGIYLTMRALLTPEDHVVTVFPAYQSLYEIAQGGGCQVSLWQAREDASQKLTFHVEDLLQLLRPNTKMVVINFPHNPTGILPSRSEFDQIVSACRERDCYLFSDEMYRYLEYDPSDRLPSACDEYAKAITLFGMSKGFGMPGVRLGWIATKDQHVLDRVRELKDFTTICCPGPSEILALMAIRQRDQIIQRNLDIIARGRAAVADLLRKHPDKFLLDMPKAGPIAFPKLVARGTKMSDYVDQLVKEAGVLLLPSKLYGLEADDRFRVSFGRESTAAAVEAWEAHLNSHGIPTSSTSA